MRDLILSGCILTLLPVILRYPACGVLTWAWFSIMSPHEEAYGFATTLPFGLAIALATIVGWLVSGERKRLTPDAMPWMMLLFLAWMTLNSFFAPYPDWSWPLWNRTIRIFAFVFLVFVLITSKVRIHGLIWVVVVAIGFYAVKGGLFTLIHGGGGIVYGPPNTILNDNNQLALAAVMTLPLANYLRTQSRNPWVRAGLAAAIALQIVMVFGSYSRGGMIALSIMLALFWWRSDRKIVYAVVTAVVVAGGLSVMPDSFWQRMATIQHASQDASFEGRVQAWHVALMQATARFPFGDGFAGGQLPAIFDQYFPGEQPHAAHSIYFEVLGDHGFPGLAIYVGILLLGLRNTWVVMRQTRHEPSLRWAYDLGRMLQISLISFYVGAAALSMAYFDALLGLLAVVSTLRELTARSNQPASSKPRSYVARESRKAPLPAAGQPVQTRRF